MRRFSISRGGDSFFVVRVKGEFYDFLIANIKSYMSLFDNYIIFVVKVPIFVLVYAYRN